MTAPASAVLVAATLLTGGGLLLGALAGPVTEPAAVVDSPRPTAAGPVTPAPGARYAWPLAPPPAVLRGFSPGPHRWSPGHRGADLSATAGQPVLAAGDGRVTFAGPLAGRGVVVVLHADGVRTTYEPVTASVTRGEVVHAGDPLGTLGPSAWHCPTGCLHWGALRGQDYLDPVDLLTGRRPPVLLPLDPALDTSADPALDTSTDPALDTSTDRALDTSTDPFLDTSTDLSSGPGSGSGQGGSGDGSGRSGDLAARSGDRRAGSRAPPRPAPSRALGRAGGTDRVACGGLRETRHTGAPARRRERRPERDRGHSLSMAPDTPEPLIAVRDLWKVFGPRADAVPASPELCALDRPELMRRRRNTIAVRDVSFEVAAGEVFVVMGLSGSGKSTLIRCLTRLIEPTAGEIRFEGEDLLSASPRRLRELRRHKIAMVFQHFGLLPHRRVVENVAYGLEIRGTPRAERTRRAMEVVELVGLSGYEHAYPEELSGGMQQRVGLARALAVEPDVLLFDEPFSALDPLIRREMQTEVARLHRELGTTMVFVTHDLSEALRLGDRILIMRGGEVAQLGTGAELVAAPADGYVRDFVRDVPRGDVLTLRWLMRPPAPDEVLDGPELGPDLVVRQAIRPVLAAGRPTRVVDGGRLLGVVGEEEILAVVGPDDAAAAAVLGRVARDASDRAAV